MKIPCFLFAVTSFLLFSCGGPGKEEKITIVKIDRHCNYSGEKVPPSVEVRQSSITYDSIFGRLYEHAMGTGDSDIRLYEIEQNEIAIANIYGAQRYILYNRRKFDSITLVTKNLNAVASILAHELGHLVNNHPLRVAQNQQVFELEADYYSGKLMRSITPSLHQSLVAMEVFGNLKETTTHPPKDIRITAIKRAWLYESIQNFRGFSKEFDSLLFVTALNKGDSSSTLFREKFTKAFNDFKNLRDHFRSTTDSIIIGDDAIYNQMGLKYHPGILLGNLMSEKLGGNSSASKLTVYDIYGLSLYSRGDKLYDANDQEVGDIYKIAENAFAQRIEIDKNSYFVNEDGTISKRFSDGKMAEIGSTTEFQ